MLSTEDNVRRLLMTENFITYGYPNRTSIQELIYKRGFIEVGGKREALTNNKIVEERLSKYNVICVEDIVHELENPGDDFI